MNQKFIFFVIYLLKSTAKISIAQWGKTSNKSYQFDAGFDYALKNISYMFIHEELCNNSSHVTSKRESIYAWWIHKKPISSVVLVNQW